MYFMGFVQPSLSFVNTYVFSLLFHAVVARSFILSPLCCHLPMLVHILSFFLLTQLLLHYYLQDYVIFCCSYVWRAQQIIVNGSSLRYDMFAQNTNVFRLLCYNHRHVNITSIITHYAFNDVIPSIVHSVIASGLISRDVA